MSTLQITRIILYVRDVPLVADFYHRHFDMRPMPGGTDKWTELAAPSGGSTIALHKASVTQKSGSAIKVVFGVADVEAFKKARGQSGLKFGVVHRVGGIEFANAKDPAGNSIQISNRGLQKM